MERLLKPSGQEITRLVSTRMKQQLQSENSQIQFKTQQGLIPLGCFSGSVQLKMVATSILEESNQSPNPNIVIFFYFFF